MQFRDFFFPLPFKTLYFLIYSAICPYCLRNLEDKIKKTVVETILFPCWDLQKCKLPLKKLGIIKS